jgi:hypothetical protein
MKNNNKDIIEETSKRLLNLCENNSAAYKCVMQLLSSNKRIDPSNGFGPLGALITLHSSNITGNNINLLFNSVCQGNVARLIAVLRAIQLGIICKTEVLIATTMCSDTKKESLNIKEIYNKVKQFLALNFDKENEARFT